MFMLWHVLLCLAAVYEILECTVLVYVSSVYICGTLMKTLVIIILLVGTFTIIHNK
jgi:hypothetical protein